METNKDYQKYQDAVKKVQEIKGFYAHFIVFCIVNFFLLFLNLKYSPEVIWVFWPSFSWGVGLLIHGMKTFNCFPFFSKEWEERKIKEYLENEKNNTK